MVGGVGQDMVCEMSEQCTTAFPAFFNLVGKAREQWCLKRGFEKGSVDGPLFFFGWGIEFLHKFFEGTPAGGTVGVRQAIDVALLFGSECFKGGGNVWQRARKAGHHFLKKLRI